MAQKKAIVVCGHYGSGKTNFSVNLALKLSQDGSRAALADLDIVNPYFRSADFGELLGRHGVELIAPRFANSNLDLPILPPRLASAIGEPELSLVIDVGGDDDGAVALGGFAEKLSQRGYHMLYVINRSRWLEDGVEEELALVSSIEQASRLKITGLVNNTNLGAETTSQLVLDSVEYMQEISAKSGIPVVCTAAEKSLCPELTGLPGLFPINIQVKTPWQINKEE